MNLSSQKAFGQHAVKEVVSNRNYIGRFSKWIAGECLVKEIFFLKALDKTKDFGRIR